MKKDQFRPDVVLRAYCFLFFAGVPTFAANQSSIYRPRESIVLACGAASGQHSDSDGRNWTGDTGSKYGPSLNAIGAQALQQGPSVPQVPYLTARVFTSPYTYSFPLGPGRKFIRLYFYPSNYSSHVATDALFSVTAGPYTFLSNFSALQTAEALTYPYFIREYSVSVSTEGLDLTFTPSTSHPNACAFINGIEIVSIPDIFSMGSPVLVTEGGPIAYSIDPSWALETLYRLNVGGQSLSPMKDSGLFRSWDDDSSYISGAGWGVTFSSDPNVTITYPTTMPNYIAPEEVYATARSMGPNIHINLNYNLTWLLTVDAGFYYLVRFHFCEIQYPIISMNQRIFDIFINNQTAKEGADVIAWSGGIGIPVYEDYVVTTAGSGQIDLWVALHPNIISKPGYYDAILNGLEVFKLQNTNSSLAGLNPIPPHQQHVDLSEVFNHQTRKSHKALPITAGVLGGVVVLLAGICLIAACRRRKTKGKHASASDGTSGWVPPSLYGNSHSAASAKTNTTGSHASSLPSNLCRHFSFAEITAATKNFDASFLLGVGGFGKVYRGKIECGTMVAIKRGNPMSEQGVHEFQTEIEMLSKLRHRHLVSLIGYSEENCEMILVYDYMAHGTLREHLYKTQKPPLTWRQRLEICIGAARGLHYLHTGAKHTIIHRDVKSTNILLDEKWVAKVSDFGLSKTGPTPDNTHVSTVVKGSFGYLDPEYFLRQQLTEKSDVYSFGVVLFEVLCARPPLNSTLPKEQVSLADWALQCQKKDILDRIMDPYLKGKIAPECFKKFAETAVKCLADVGTERPSMGDVLWSLEFALQLQENAEVNASAVGVVSDETMPVVMAEKKDPGDSSTSTSISIGGQSLASEYSSGLTHNAVFSQIMNPEGR